MKRTAQEAIDVPTLGQVAKEDDLEPLRELIRLVANRPVTEFGPTLKDALRKEVGNELKLVFASFVDACDARAGDVAEKRPHVEKSTGEQWSFFLSYKCMGIV
jgi:hypothetical protein